MIEDLKEIASSQRRIETAQSRMEQKLDTTHDWVKAHDVKITAIEADVNKAKGGWMAVLGLSGLAGALGGMFTKFFTR